MLPGAERKAPAAWRIAIGERDTNKGFPRKLDHFKITSMVKKADGYVHSPDKAMNELLQLVTGMDKPTFIPVIFPFETADGVYSAMAAFTRNYRVCYCDKFTVKTEAQATAQGLPWPPPDRDRDGWPIEQAYYAGLFNRARLRQEKDKRGENVYKVASRYTGACDPVNCPFTSEPNAQDLMSAFGGVFKSMLGKRCCKPQVVVPLILPWVDMQSPHAQFSSTGWYTARALVRSLGEIQSAAGNAPLYSVPLRLTVDFPVLPTPEGRMAVPVVQFGPGVGWRELPDAVHQHLQRLADNRQVAEQLRAAQSASEAIVRKQIDDPDAVRAFASEFHPEADSSPMVSEGMAAAREASDEAASQGPAIDEPVDVDFEASDPPVYEPPSDRRLGV